MAKWSRHRSVWIASACVGAVAVFALVWDHRAHGLGALPYLLLLACPLMHLFHGGHGSHAAEDGGTRPAGGRTQGRASDARKEGHV